MKKDIIQYKVVYDKYNGKFIDIEGNYVDKLSESGLYPLNKTNEEIIKIFDSDIREFLEIWLVNCVFEMVWNYKSL